MTDLSLQEIDEKIQKLLKLREEITGPQEYLLIKDNKLNQNFWVLEPSLRNVDAEAVKFLIEHTKDPLKKEILTEWLLEETDYRCVMGRPECSVNNSHVCCGMCANLAMCSSMGEPSICPIVDTGIAVDIEDCIDYHNNL